MCNYVSSKKLQQESAAEMGANKDQSQKGMLAWPAIRQPTYYLPVSRLMLCVFAARAQPTLSVSPSYS